VHADDLSHRTDSVSRLANATSATIKSCPVARRALGVAMTSFATRMVGRRWETLGSLKPFAIGVALFVLSLSADWICRRFLGGRRRILIDFVLGVVAGLIALLYEQLRTRHLLLLFGASYRLSGIVTTLFGAL
jgi:hypothetical protein